MLSALCVYGPLFEEKFIQASIQFYKNEGEKLVQKIHVGFARFLLYAELKDFFNKIPGKLISIDWFQPSDYLHHVASRIREEEARYLMLVTNDATVFRCDLYLLHSTRAPLLNVLDIRLIEKSMEVFVKKGWFHCGSFSIQRLGTAELLDQAKYVELKMMYDLLGRVTNGRVLLRSEFSDFIKVNLRIWQV